jgi:hypothetical protein
VSALRVFLVVTIALVLPCLAPFAAAQVRTTGEIHGVVSDPSGNVVPGAQVDLTDVSTGITKSAKTETDGAFLFLNLLPGKYQLKVTAQGFQVAIYSDVVVDAGRRTDLPVGLKVGQLTETVEVTAAAQQLETTSNQIAATVRSDFVQQLPLAGRDTLQFALLMAGSQTIDSGRTSTFNGLPNASMNITIDGTDNSSQRFKSGGTSFWAFAPVRLDAIDEVTVSTTGQGADASGGGAMTIRFVTKRGTEQYHGKLFEQFRNDALNANSFINNLRGNRKPKLRQNEFGGNFGGPLPLPFDFLKKKVFFFAKMEAMPRPSTGVFTTDILTPDAQKGFYSYVGSDGNLHKVNVLQLAGQAGYQSTIDPTIQGILNTINGTTSQGSFISSADPNVQTLQWRQDTGSKVLYPTARVDYQITPKIAWHGTWNLRWQHNNGSPNYPGLKPLGNAYDITVYVASSAVDWTITPTMLNSFNFGVQSNGEYFYKGIDIHQWAPYGNRRIHLAWMQDVLPNQTPWIRNNPVYNLYDNISWVKNKHTLTFGGSLLKTSFWETTWNSAGVLDWYVDSLDSNDPILSVLTQSAFPYISSADVANAGNLYATLTGRISGIYGSRNVDEKTHQYQDFSSATQRFARSSGGLYAQDSFRVTPQLTLNYGFRWELSGAIWNTNKIDTPPDLANFWGPSTRLFHPGELNGVMNPMLTVRPRPYKADKINPAPNFGFAWSPKFEQGLPGKIFSDKTVIRSSYAINYYDEGLNSISNYVSGNAGTFQNMSLWPGLPGFEPGGLTLASPNIPPYSVFPESFSFPMPLAPFTFSWLSDLSTTQPTLHTPYVQNWTFGIQREIARGTVIEARYVGNKATHIWRQYNMNETNIFESGFLTDFKNAQNNLKINQAAGVNSFANRGLPGQVALPMFEAAFGALGSQGNINYNFTSSAFITNLQQGTAGDMANAMASDSMYLCRMVGNTFGPCADYGYDAPGKYPMNIFRANPFAGNLFYKDDSGNTNYHGLQLELRKDYSHGLTFRANYTFSKTLGDFRNSVDQAGESQFFTLRNFRLNRAPTPFDIRHTFQTYWTYSLPFGQGRKWEVSNAILRRVLGGWTISGLTKITSGRNYRLTSGRNTFNGFGWATSPVDSGVVLKGMSYSDLSAGLTTFSPGPNKNLLFADPKLVGADGRANPAYLGPPTTPGVFDSFLYMYGPTFVSTDAGLLKEIPIRERMRFEFQMEWLNAFNHPVFGVGTTDVTSRSFGQTTSTMVGPRNIQLRAALAW